MMSNKECAEFLGYAPDTLAKYRCQGKVKCGSLFSGIGGFDLGFELAGFKTVWQVESEPFCRAILRTHFPNSELFDDVQQCGAPNLEQVDCITAGVPCQDVSVAGKRAGLSGERTGLFYEFARILQELRPAWFVFENVPGLLSSNKGRDFAEILRVLMVECGYGVCWRVLDSQFFGVAQRRRRVFIVGCFGKPCPPEVLFESQSSEGDSPKGRKAGQGVANAVTGGVGRVGSRGADDGANIIPTLQAGGAGTARVGGRGAEPGFYVSHVLANSGSGYRYDPNGEDFVVANTLRESDGHHGWSGGRGDGCDNLIAFDTTQITSPGNYSNPKPGDPCHPLAEGGHPPAVAGFNLGAGAKAGSIGYEEEISPTLRTGDRGNKAAVIAIQDVRGKREQRGHGIGISEGGPSYTLGAVDRHGICAPSDPDRVRDFAEFSEGLDDSLPKGMDSARYRALGNAVSVCVAYWIAKRIVDYEGSL